MIQCPFCHFDNEDGALFCEQCKSDLASAEPGGPVHSAQPAIAHTMPSEPIETVPLVAPVVEPVHADAVVAEAIVAEAMPIEGYGTMEAMVPTVTPMPAEPGVSEAPAGLEAAPAPGQIGVPVVGYNIEAPAPEAPTGPAPTLPPGTEPRLVVLRGQKRGVEYPLYEGHNFVGRADEKPVDIDLEDQEPPDRIWSSRQHALIALENGQITIEDLSSSNGTFVNRARIYPAQRVALNVNDVVQIGTVQLKVIV